MPCLPCMQLNPSLQILNECYPPPKDLLKSGPEFMPLSQDTSKLTYYATNKPSSLGKIGDELERRIAKEARASTGGYPKSRASLLISLVILHRLLTECKGEIGKFALQTMRMISSALDVKVYQKNDTDLEVAARAASCFKAFATFTDGAAIGVDDTLTDEYLGVLSKFAQMATTQHTSEKPDDEEQSRTRLVGLQALSSAAGSEAVFGSNVEFPRQVKIIVPALLTIISEAPLAELKEDSSKKSPVGGDNVSPFFREFAVRKPINDRRAPSLHEHVPGEKGPGSEDVRSAALRCFYDLIGECQASQANTVLDVCFGFLDKTGWSDVERCCWLAERLTAAMLLQSRFVVPTRLVELLVNLPDDSPPTQKHSSVLAMITTILSSNVSLVGLAITDILASLLSVIIRRVGVDSRDALLPALVQCVSSLGTHIYYADQINDIVEEIALQILAVPTTNPAQQETLRVLIYCITGVMKAADLGDQAEARVTSPISEKPGDKGKAPLLETPAIDTRRGLGRRNPIAPEVWQETLPLMCEASYPVRAAYVQAFVFYLETEMPRDRKPRPNEPNITRFCNAVMASIYTLAISSKLGVAEALPTPPDSPHPIEKISDPVEKIADAATSPSKAVSWNVNVIEPTPNGSVASKANPPAINVPVANAAASTTGNSGHTTPVSRKPLRGGRRVSLPLNRLESGANLTSFDNVATPFDYSAILRILDELNNCVPVAALLTAAPMLLALDRDAATELIRRPGDGRTGAWVLERKRACRETVAFAWRRLADRWGVASAVQLADRAINSLPEPFTVPDWRAPLSHDDVLPPPAEPAAFFRDQTEGESQSSSQPIIDPAQLVTAFSTSPSVQATTGRDQASIARRFTSPWNVELAIKESLERYSSSAPDGELHGNAAEMLMAIPNASYQSLGQPVSRSVDVADLRDALDGGGGDRASVANGSGANSFVSTATDVALGSSPDAKRPKPPKPDTKDILNQIFKDNNKRKAKTSNGPKVPPSADAPINV